mmetsp:Transcript_46046/g.118778  ORF Transcript_46046/g.118778 Transcript_46046/m.118778 type:complete len:81 (+) Transcript_46046:149-391(+)
MVATPEQKRVLQIVKERVKEDVAEDVSISVNQMVLTELEEQLEGGNEIEHLLQLVGSVLSSIGLFEHSVGIIAKVQGDLQ